MNFRPLLSALSLLCLAGLSSCDKDTKVFDDADLSSERSTVAGRVTGVGDTGVSGVVVTAQAVAADGALLADVPAQTALSGEGGRFSLLLQPGRKWKISWQSPDYRTDEGQGTTVDLGLHQTVDLPEAKRLKYRYGWIAGRTAPNAAVAIEGQDVSTLADDQGRFRIARVVPGTVSVVGILPGKGSWRVTEQVQAETIDTVRGVEQIASWRPLSKLTGVLVNTDGTPQQGAKLSALGGLVTATTDVQGRFLLENLPARGRVVVQVSRGVGTRERLVLPTAGEDSTAELGELPLSGSFTGSGIYLGNGLVVADSGDVVTIPLLWELIDSSRTVLGFAWDTSGQGNPSRALRTWGPRTPELKVGSRSRTISAWVVVAVPRADGRFDTSWSSEARLSILVRSKAAPPDSLKAPVFSHDPKQAWFGPLRVGLSSSSTGATLLWSSDSSRWNLWDPDDSILLYDTTTVWAFVRQRGKLDSRIVSATFAVRPSAVPETLQASLASSVKLPQGSLFQAFACPNLAEGVSLVLDSGATLKIPANCVVNIDVDDTLEMRAGSRLILGSGSRLVVGSGTPGTFLAKGRPGRRAALVAANASNPPAGNGYHVLHLMDFSDGSRIEGLDLDGSAGGGILVQDAEIDISGSRIRNCKASGITFEGTGRPLSPDAMATDSLAGNRWGVTATPFATGNIPTIAGLSDTLLVANTGTVNPIAGTTTWKGQPRPLVVQTPLEVEAQSALTLDSGLTLLMDKGTWIRVGSGSEGSLHVAGTARAPVVLRARTSSGWGLYPDDENYGGIQLDDQATNVIVHHLRLSGSRSNGIMSVVPVSLEAVRLDSNTFSGIRFEDQARPTSFKDIGARGNRWAVSATPFAFGDLTYNAGLEDTVRVIDLGSSNPLTGAATWVAQPRPVVVTEAIEVAGNASLLLDSGLVLLFDKGTWLRVGSGSPGSLQAIGTSGAPVVLRPRSKAGWGLYPGDKNYGALQIDDAAHDVVLRLVALSGSLSNGIMSHVPLDIRQSRLDSNALSGIRFEDLGTPVESSFTAIAARGNRWSVSTTPYALGRIPTNKALLDTVRLLDEGATDAVEGNATWAPQSLPIVVAQAFDIQSGAHLTLQAGSNLLFDIGSYVRVGNGSAGSLDIAGSATAPVRMGGHGSYWGFETATTSGYGLYLGANTTSARIQYLALRDIPTNGILMEVDQPYVVTVGNVSDSAWSPVASRNIQAVFSNSDIQQNIDLRTISLTLP